jgi:RNA:NAD 2'-phosphotransferase (TPT1/KptA family)
VKIFHAHGWVDVVNLLSKRAAVGVSLMHELLLVVAAENDEQRFTLRDNGMRKGTLSPSIIATPVKKRPPVLYRGNVRKFVESIST